MVGKPRLAIKVNCLLIVLIANLLWLGPRAVLLVVMYPVRVVQLIRTSLYRRTDPVKVLQLHYCTRSHINQCLVHINNRDQHR